MYYFYVYENWAVVMTALFLFTLNIYPHSGLFIINNTNTMRAKERKVVTGQPHRKVIRQYDKFGNFLYEWPSIRTMCASLGLDRRAVRRAINKEKGYKSVKSFVFVERKLNT